ncbi:M17 family metallopeptidase [Parvularcula marina]|uniref:leucyl aminopeptidase family protein n=1 Tax=Parvularcula marina TaxID=2292771 RepID=UPI0035141A51
MSEWPAGIAAKTDDNVKGATPIHLIPAQNADAMIEELAPSAARIAAQAGFRGELGQVLPTGAGVLIGAGGGDDPFALGAGAAALGEGHYVLKTQLPGEAAYLAALSWAFGAYRFTTYRGGAPVPTLLLGKEIDTDRLIREAEAASLVRDMVNTPAEEMGPEEIEAEVRKVADAYGADVEVTTGQALVDGFPLVNAVGRAATRGPRLIDLHWGPKNAPKLTIVGKGVCFDSGGLNIKGGAGMSLMKKDMGGAANALGLARMIMAAKLNIRLRLIIPAVENAISGNAFRPGDVFRSRQGMTVEISNTDAEGRLILADGLALAAEEKPDHIISLATLTGAARVALGPDLPPIYSTRDSFAERVALRSHEIADPVWPMPLWRRYDEFLKSQIADVNHASASSFAGSITAALFLNRFVPTEIPYTHLDIFAWVPAARPGHPQGGAAMGIRALFDVVSESVT